jgi:hypothetical protein
MRLGKARLPFATDEYDRAWGDQLVRAIDQNFDAIFADAAGAYSVNGYYGSFYDTTDQTAAAINTPYAMTFNSTALASQVAMIDGSKITFKIRGLYSLQFVAQLDQTAGGAQNIYVWIRKNNVDVAQSATKISLQGIGWGVGGSAAAAPSWNFVVSVLSEDYIQIMWATDNTGAFLSASAATAFCPAIPSVAVTVVTI